MQGNSTSTVLGRRLGAELIKLRTAVGMTQPQAAETLTASTAKVAKMERGWVPIRDPDIRALCELYGVTDPATVGSLLELARVDRDRRKAKGWWNQYPELPDLVQYVALEDIATSLRTWQLACVPGLLQTAGYARSLAVGNGLWEDPDAIEPFVESRMARQARLTGESPLHLWAVLHEAAIRQLVGGRRVMREQLGHLLDSAQLPNVHLQVVPHSAGAHPGMTSAFTIVSFAEPGAMDVVYMDTASSTLWLESEADATHHSGIFDRITRLSLAQRDSADLIADIRKEM
ncbi:MULTISPECIES: helix-turn-helix transcriptional regulator [Streptomyces]|uniref:Helix-turn-helix domain-containing protein n=1 Tax=Streptomyces lycii TaxID=2654337 RepID=A0ABQ7FLW6_9ACTN|nr:MULTISPECIES: helix-turn-helix transcriptional regulator [Streptomyces]KAF4409947.1 helix-turn-helix domain-containing protein [Streptomyces lycii]PGH50505.1 DNA-binding protein [Streptomyces sp. Ru87]